MKKLTHLAAGLVLASSGLIASSAHAELSYNIGWASEYYSVSYTHLTLPTKA